MSIKQKKRLNEIIKLLSHKERMSVREIAETLSVSEMTIRRDLNNLQSGGIINRTHGGATLFDIRKTNGESYILGEQIEKNAKLKSAIGLKAASLIEPNETIFLDSGSTTPFIAKYVDPEIPITVLCYTLKNAFILNNRKNTNLILAGGYYHKFSNIFHSREGCELIKKVRADKAFIAAAGIDIKLGLTTVFYFEADIKRAMVKSAQKVILVADSSKFGKVSTINFATLDEVHTIITDNGINEDMKSSIIERGIELIIAD
ncbi:MAG: DeoR/GlpR transcriptional regulator [Spirochaetales bacterium]|nr:DeoR/GlpR transcriptional regulator [Spirochaetales bacterium]